MGEEEVTVLLDEVPELNILFYNVGLTATEFKVDKR